MTTRSSRAAAEKAAAVEKKPDFEILGKVEDLLDEAAEDLGIHVNPTTGAKSIVGVDANGEVVENGWHLPAEQGGDTTFIAFSKRFEAKPLFEDALTMRVILVGTVPTLCKKGTVQLDLLEHRKAE